MARYRKVDVRIRADARFRRLSKPQPNGQTLWFHLLTGPHTIVIPGLSAIGEAALAEELGWPLEGFRKAFREVFREGLAKADWEARVVWVPNAIKYDPPQSPNVVKSWAAAWDEIPECSLKTEAWHALRDFLEGFGEAFLKAFLKACPKPSPNQEQEQEQEQDQDRALTGSVEQARDEREPLELVPPEADPDRLTPERLVGLWNEATGGRITRLEPARRAAIRDAIKRQPDPEFWRRCFGKAATLRRLEGNGWLTFDWLLAKSSRGLGWNAERVESGAFDFKLRDAAAPNIRTGYVHHGPSEEARFAHERTGDITDEF